MLGPLAILVIPVNKGCFWELSEMLNESHKQFQIGMLRGGIEAAISYRMARSSLDHFSSLHAYLLIMGILSQDSGIQVFSPDNPEKLIYLYYMN